MSKMCVVLNHEIKKGSDQPTFQVIKADPYFKYWRVRFCKMKPRRLLGQDDCLWRDEHESLDLFSPLGMGSEPFIVLVSRGTAINNGPLDGGREEDIAAFVNKTGCLALMAFRLQLMQFRKRKDHIPVIVKLPKYSNFDNKHRIIWIFVATSNTIIWQINKLRVLQTIDLSQCYRRVLET